MGWAGLPGTEGEGAYRGKTRGAFWGPSQPRMKIGTPTCRRCEEVLRVYKETKGRLALG